MFFGYSLWTVALICLGVFLAGLVDAIGGGGGLISLPMYMMAGLPQHFSLGTNKMSACLGTVASTVRYIKNGFVRWDLALVSIPLAMAGAWLGTKAQLLVPEDYLRYLLLAVLPLVAVVMLRKKNLPETAGEISPVAQRLIVWLSCLVIGVYDGFYGPGTGTFLLLCFCYLGKMDLRTASGNMKVVNLSSNVGALLTSLAAGKVLVPIGLLAAVFSVAGQYLGAGLILKNGSKLVRPVLFVVLGMLCVKVLWEIFA